MMSGEVLLAVGLLLLAVVLLALLFLRVSAAAPAGRATPPLKLGYERLGRTAPGDPCPCPSAGATKRPYAECCRAKDVAELEEDVRRYLWKHWSHHSYAGRRRSRSMKHRLEDHPLPNVVLPDWVTSPKRFTFPIDEPTLRGWSPVAPARHGGKSGVPEELGEGLPFWMSTRPLRSMSRTPASGVGSSSTGGRSHAR